jgi:hypothetical protein
MENNSINIFYKIFQIMDHYETVLDNYSYKGNKYKPDEKFNDFMNADDFFSFIAKQVPVNKAPKRQPVSGNAPTDDDDDFFSAGAPPPPSAEDKPPADQDPFASEENASDAVPKTDEDAIVKKYIKKCYRFIVLKCHPDKNTDMANSSALFIKCKDYYNEQLLIGLLYIFYLYKIKPPHPLDISTPVVPDDDCNILIDRILREIRVIQDKLMELNSPVQESVQPEPEPEPEPSATDLPCSEN